ncbi:MAG: energy transducer TonB [Nitrospinae bacterium]|nr:energy transducer TonB [Nitrospinota bacterium]MBL7019477.1 energy transducer TonB [Nitrospinaceae bacterium]
MNRTRLSGFILVSLGIHLTTVIVHMALPTHEEKIKGPPPIQVKYIEPEKTKAAKTGQIIDTPTPPKKTEKARTKELLAKYDSRSHSNTAKKTAKTYQRKKTMVPKSKGSAGKTSTAPVREKKTADKPQKRASIKPRKRLLPESDIGKYKSLSKEKPQPSTSSANPKAGIGNSLALLDGFDPEPFASLNTEDLENIDDDEPVSLDTTEVKYASYFARIKHQIERVWIYPTEAAERGISGDLTLTFRISKDGNLLGVRLMDRSGYEILDVAALKAVKEAAPFYPFPTTIQREKLSIQANFVYTPQFAPIVP